MIEDNINTIKEELNRMVDEKNLTTSEILELSIALDKKILEFYRQL